MRAIAIACVLFVFGTAGTTSAFAGEPDGCFSTEGTLGIGPGYRAGHEALQALGEGGSAPTGRIASALGAQFGGEWLEATLDGWGIGLAPGPLDVPAARALVEAQLDTLAPELAAAAKASLRVAPEPYSWAELNAVQEQISAFAASPGAPVLGGFGVGCTMTRAFRVEMTLFDPTSADDEARARAFLAQFGDKVVVTRVAGPGATADVGHPTQPLPKGTDGAPSAATVQRGATRSGATLRVRVTCPKVAVTPCAGAVSLRLKPRRGAGHRIAVVPFTALAPGASRTLTAKLSRAERVALAGRRPAAVTASIRTGTKAGAARRLDVR